MVVEATRNSAGQRQRKPELRFGDGGWLYLRQLHRRATTKLRSRLWRAKPTSIVGRLTASDKLPTSLQARMPPNPCRMAGWPAPVISSPHPGWILFENVPSLLLYENGRVALEIARAFREIGYAVVPMILLAADFGVPQLRRRLVFVGNRTRSDIAEIAAELTRSTML